METRAHAWRWKTILSGKVERNKGPSIAFYKIAMATSSIYDKFLSYQDGRNYSGNFDYDSIKGNGTMWFPNGTVYKGNFHYGIMMGNAGNKNLQMSNLITILPRLSNGHRIYHV